MSEVDLAELRAEMEEERAWREAELRLLKNQIAALSDEDDRRISRKALVVMLYAHFEGVCKALLGIYVNKINLLKLKTPSASPSLSAASLSAVFKGLRDPNTKCKVFAKTLPDDSALHRFARDREFVETAWTFAERIVSIDADDIVDTESNLKPIVLRKILYRLGLDPKLAEPWEAAISQLLQRRNDVAHGTARIGLSAKDYANLEQAVMLVVDDLVKTVSRAVADRQYLAVSTPPT